MDVLAVFHSISLATIFYALLLLIPTIFVAILVGIRMTTWDVVPEISRFDSEKYYKDPNKNNATYPFPIMEEEGSIDLSVIVPSYNEEERLPVMLDETFEYLENEKKNKPSFTYEIIVVDDGSKDATSKVALEYSKKYGVHQMRVLTLEKNRGKGGAVRLGVFSSRGRRLLMADADGASKFADLARLERALDDLNGKKGNKAVIICGSRAHLQEEAVAQRSLFRNFLMYVFHFLVWFLCVRGIKDTQCGFKLFTRPAALLTFSALHVERWAFDVELLYIAQQLKITLGEVAINWEEIEGSKMVPVWSWLQMGKDLLLINLRYVVGAWRIEPMKLKTQ
ncbi:dolichyl-phosphate beta-glucosyltransferase [Desmophyllum pertusum]|uniref:Dolichyl-phosphate beta-glucosyltransferase n=1 Tax=Desmophyllum pertusum TaxID=174260 RepID=A0A9W9YM14_9CNID|nr:dolichyl-phosphate beta-glucosyltransferase [Desmophyllum pertusum]